MTPTLWLAVHVQYLLSLPLPECLKSFLQPSIFFLRPRSYHDAEPVEFPFETRLEALSRAYREGLTQICCEGLLYFTFLPRKIATPSVTDFGFGSFGTQITGLNLKKEFSPLS